MRIRAIGIGLFGAVFIATAGYLNNEVLKLESIVAGHLLPIFVLGSLVVFLAMVNPFLRAIQCGLGSRDLAVIVTLMMVGCSIPARGLMQSFTPALAMPVQYSRTLPGWRSAKLLEYVPPQMLVNDGHYNDAVMDGFRAGTPLEVPPAEEGRSAVLSAPARYGRAMLGQVPWSAWSGPLRTFVPLLVLLSICVICLGLIVHRQWVYHERLRYPIAEFSTTLMAQEPGRWYGPVFRSKMFWWGLGIILAIRVINGVAVWYPDVVTSIPMQWRFDQVWTRWPVLAKSVWSRLLFKPTIYPAVVAFTFFLASDVAASLSLAHVLITPIVLLMLARGMDISNDYMSGGAEGWQRFGSYAGFAVMLLYIGRRYYLQVLKQALTFRSGEGVQPYAAWACRLLLLAAAAMAVLITRLGLPWALSVAMVLMILMMFLVVSRISAETGLFFIQARWQPLGVFLGLLGIYALGPEAILICGILCVVLCLDPSQSLMPYFINGLRMCAATDLKPGRIGTTAGATYLIALLLGVGVVLFANYTWGINQDDSWGYSGVPKMSFNAAEKAVTQLKLSGELAASNALKGFERITNARPDPRFIGFAVGGFVLVLLVSWLRLRFSWWPLHPVIFLVWATFPMVYFAHSFMLGWLIKSVVTRLGGYQSFKKAKPLMMGVIAGDLLGGLIFMLAGAIYYKLTGLMPNRYTILPE